MIAIIANRMSATIEKMTPGPANRVLRQWPSKAIPVRMTPTVATRRAKGLERRQRLARAGSTDSTTVSPPYAATTPLTTAIGPTRRPVKYAQIRPGTDQAEQRREGQGDRVRRDARAREQGHHDERSSPRRAGHPRRRAGCRSAGWRALKRCPWCPRRGRHRVRSGVRWASAEPSGQRGTSCYHSAPVPRPRTWRDPPVGM